MNFFSSFVNYRVQQICAYFGEGQTEFILTFTKYTGKLDTLRSINIQKKVFWKPSKTVLKERKYGQHYL